MTKPGRSDSDAWFDHVYTETEVGDVKVVRALREIEAIVTASLRPETSAGKVQSALRSILAVADEALLVSIVTTSPSAQPMGLGSDRHEPPPPEPHQGPLNASGTTGRPPLPPPKRGRPIEAGPPRASNPVKSGAPWDSEWWGGDSDSSDEGELGLSSSLVTSSCQEGKGRRWRLNTKKTQDRSCAALVSLVSKRIKWKVVSGKADVYFVMNENDLMDSLSDMPPKSRVSRILGMPRMCSKHYMARGLKFAASAYSDKFFSFWPETWHLPEQIDQLEEALPARPPGQKPKSKEAPTFIVKPEAGSQGEGIYLVQSLQQFRTKWAGSGIQKAVVQRYLSNPMLLDNLKFDLRMYVLVTSVCPLRTYLCTEGLARFCTQPYQKPDLGNLHNTTAHLTNYSINKRSETFNHGQTGEGGEEEDRPATPERLEQRFGESSKRPLSTCLHQLAQRSGFSIDSFWEKMNSLVIATLALMEPDLYAASVRAGEPPNRSFQVLGFDVMIDSEGEVYLLEVNNSPSLRIDEMIPVDSPGGDEGPAPDPAPGRPNKKQVVDLPFLSNPNMICTCMDHHTAHYHRVCEVDCRVKTAAIGDALRILRSEVDGEFLPPLPHHCADILPLTYAVNETKGEEEISYYEITPDRCEPEIQTALASLGLLAKAYGGVGGTRSTLSLQKARGSLLKALSDASGPCQVSGQELDIFIAGWASKEGGKHTLYDMDAFQFGEFIRGLAQKRAGDHMPRTKGQGGRKTSAAQPSSAYVSDVFTQLLERLATLAEKASPDQPPAPK